MSAWLLLASYDDGGERMRTLCADPQSLESVTCIVSDDDPPAESEIAGALEDFSGMEDGQELLLVPLDAAVKVNAQSVVKITYHIEIAE